MKPDLCSDFCTLDCMVHSLCDGHRQWMSFETDELNGIHLQDSRHFLRLHFGLCSMTSDFHDQHVLAAGRKVRARPGMDGTDAQSSAVEIVQRLGNLELGRGTFEDDLTLVKFTSVF